MGLSFNEIAATHEGSVLLVDGLNLAFRYRDYTKSWAQDFVRTVASIANSYKCEKVFVLADKGSSSYRKNIYPEYKMNRKKKYDAQTEEEKEQSQLFFKFWEEALELIPDSFPLIRFDKVEADDIAGYIVKNKTRFGINQIWLVSSDKDWDLLVGEGVSRFSTITRKETTVENWSEHYDCSMEELVHVKALMGDSGDGIVGVEGLGPKRSLAIVQQYGSVFDIIDSAPLPGKAKYIQNLNNSLDTIALNIELVDIKTFCEEAIGQDNIKVIDSWFL